MKKIIYLLLVLALVLGLASCSTGKSQSSSSAVEEEEEGNVFELSVETYFNGTKENEDGETVGVFAYILWYSDRAEYIISEYVSDFDNVVYYQDGVAYYGENEDDPLVIERTEDDPGSIEILLEGNNALYKIIREDGEDDFVLGVMTEDEFKAISK